MIIDDDYIINKFKKRIHRWITELEKQYLLNRYTDCYNYKESAYRIIHNINIVPKCPICNKPLKYVGGHRHYLKTCGESYCNKQLTNINVKTTKLKLYGCSNYNNIEKCKQTKLERYNNPNYNNIEKNHQTKLERYNNPNYNNIEKQKATCLDKYNYNSFLQSNDYKKHMENQDVKQIKLHHEYLTKKKNNSFNKSTIEEQLKEYFINNNIKFKYQYKSDLYPFVCDFYFPDKDLYVEIQGTWTHGGKPFEGTLEDLLKLQNWCEKNTEYYDNAIDTWTIRDVKKRNVAKQNNLNYMEIFSKNLNVIIKKIMY